MKNILNQKGFTLVEILVTIGLLALLGVGIGVSLNKVLKNQEENTYETFIEKIKSSSLLYSSNSETIMNDLEFNNGYVLISMNDLINGGYIRENVKNPNTNETLKELGINEKGEDYSKARVYYSMDKEMIIDLAVSTKGYKTDEYKKEFVELVEMAQEPMNYEDDWDYEDDEYGDYYE